ncbi:hypothetical protein [uncultured Cohaesibacter sp.]|uniref:hypothetical protein n=1 Tax=uncultured Cohaesibacter sp. TaxID=1002546 RepID=UPI0029C72366|nr:hypothetical protein [uncultured Cohaesibacter sp.]
MVVFDPVKFMGFVAGSSLLGAVLLLGSPAKSQEVSVEYTKIDAASCMTLVLNEEEGYSEQVCKGADGIAVFVSDGDLRQSVSYRNQDAGDRRFGFGNFNHVGDTIEWRIKEDERGWARPYATILRWHVSLDDNNEQQALVITKIEDRDFCVAGLVDASTQSNANELARQIADEVTPSFVCGQDEAQWHGETGLLAAASLR